MQIVISPNDLDPSYAGMSLTVTEVLTPPALPPGMAIAGTVLSLGPPGVKFLFPVPLALGLRSVSGSNPGGSTASPAAANTTNSTRRVQGLDTAGLDNGQVKVINFKYVAGINPNNGDPAPEWMPVTASEQSSTVNAFGDTVKTSVCLISGFSIYAPLSNVNYPNMGLDGNVPGTKVGPYGQTTTSAGKEIYIGFAVFGVLLMLMYYIILLPKWAHEPPPPPPPKRAVTPPPPPPKEKIRPPAALPLAKPMYVQAEPVRFHHGTPIKHFGPTFDDIFDKDDLNWWAQQQAKAEYNFPKLPFDPKADAQLGYNKE